MTAGGCSPERRSRPTPRAIALRAWIERFAPVAVIGVESTASYAAGLVRYLRAEVLEVLGSTNRTRTRARGAARAIRSTPNWPSTTCWPHAVSRMV